MAYTPSQIRRHRVQESSLLLSKSGKPIGGGCVWLGFDLARSLLDLASAVSERTKAALDRRGGRGDARTLAQARLSIRAKAAQIAGMRLYWQNPQDWVDHVLICED